MRSGLVGVDLGRGFSAKAQVYYDFDEVEDFYGNVGVVYARELSDGVRSELSGFVGSAGSSFVARGATTADREDMAAGGDGGWHEYTIAAGLTWNMKEAVTCGARLAYTDSLNKDTPLNKSTVGNRVLWQGREYSWETGLYYFRARWCDPVTGRWLRKDPIGIAGGLNQYVFCANNPLNRRDVTGNQWTTGLPGGVGSDSAAFAEAVGNAPGSMGKPEAASYWESFGERLAELWLASQEYPPGTEVLITVNGEATLPQESIAGMITAVDTPVIQVTVPEQSFWYGSMPIYTSAPDPGFQMTLYPPAAPPLGWPQPASPSLEQQICDYFQQVSQQAEDTQ